MMFVSSVFRRLSLQPSQVLFFNNWRKCSLQFGDPRMPDKLYKNIELEITCSDKAVIASYVKFILTAAENLNITVGEVSEGKKPHISRRTLLKSVHVYRKHMVQYETRTYYNWVNLQKLTGSTADTILEYAERMLPEGVALKVTKTAIETMPTHINVANIKESSQKTT